MSRLQLPEVLDRAVAAGVLGDAAPPDGEERPWPVVAMTAIGAWIAAIPMCALVAMLFWPVLKADAGAYLLGVLLLGASLTVLKAPHLPLFVEQLAIPGMLVGKGLLVFCLFRDTPPALACFVSGLLTLGAAAVVPMAWLRTLLGIVSALWTGGLMMFVLDNRWSPRDIDAGWWVLHTLLLVWVLALAVQRHASAAAAAWLEALATGWLIVVLCGLAWLTGATFMVGSLGIDTPAASLRMFGLEASILSAALALAASAWLPRQWPSLRKAALVALPLVAVPLAWLMPALGGVLLATVICAASARWRQTALGALAAAWIIGAFYYQLSWTLVTKSYVMVLAGGLLGAAAWHLRTASPAQPRIAEARLRAPAVLVIGAALLTLLVANVGIWQKQQLIANGRVMLVALGPVDPRSLMQGDYMTLEFPTLPVPRDADDPVVVLALDERGVASPVRRETEDSGHALAPNEVRVRMVFKGGRWKLVTDAWHFAEGQGDRFAAAGFGEFRVLDDGRALLVGLRDAKLQPINP